MDGPPRTKPPDRQQPTPQNGKAQGRSYAHPAKGKGKIQMTKLLHDYIKIKEHAATTRRT